MKKITTLLTFTMLSLAPLSAMAADAPAPAQHEGGYAEYWKRVDPDNKGYITKEAYLAETARRFAEIDANHDGKITKDEMSAYHNKLRDQARAHFQQMQGNRQGAATPQK